MPKYLLLPKRRLVALCVSNMKAAVKDALKELGLNVEDRGSMKGSSGITHTFDLLATTPDGRVVAVDIHKPEDPRGSLIALLAKSYDVKPSKTVLVIDTGISQEVLTLARLCEIELVYASRERLKEELQKALRLEKR